MFMMTEDSLAYIDRVEGFEVGFEEVFIHGNLAIVHGQYDVIAIDYTPAIRQQAAGTACGKGVKTALRDDRPRLNSSGRTTGQTVAQSPHAVHSCSDT